MGYSGERYARPDQWSNRDDTTRSVADSQEKSMEHRAAELHAANRRRADLFNQSVMADQSMDIMLTALIALEQGTVLTRAAAAMANRISMALAESITDELISARLMQRGERRDQIMLTQLGADLMREYVNRAGEMPTR
jgi:predicted transcriptional regulator